MTGTDNATPTEHRIASSLEDWQAALSPLLDEEDELAKRSSELALKRRQLPWLPVMKNYAFDTAAGKKALADLFEGRPQLLMYHMMFGPDWSAGCPACSALVDNLDGGMAHLNQHDVTMVVVSHAPVEKLQAYKERMGWKFKYVSSFDSDFNFDFGFSFTAEQRKQFADAILAQFAGNQMVEELAASCGTDLAGYVTTEAPGLSAFILEDGVVYRTYTCPPPHTSVFSAIMVYEQLLERTAKGHDDSVTLRRHDEYR
jgi:predicted dithiol-disulfide oxidoreductase (DUF899 family)